MRQDETNDIEEAQLYVKNGLGHFVLVEKEIPISKWRRFFQDYNENIIAVINTILLGATISFVSGMTTAFLTMYGYAVMEHFCRDNGSIVQCYNPTPEGTPTEFLRR